ncbi:MAG: hypothetical protein IPH93_03925 [Saprospiraceae bacterium]|nr:hypothetical protein [Saprospiraceae bacterium]
MGTWLTKFCILVLVFLYQISAYAQYSILNQSGDIRANALSQTGVVTLNPTSAINNPAHAALTDFHQVGLISHPYIRTSELSFVSLHSSFKLSPKQGIGIILQREGSTHLNEFLAGINFGQKLGEHSSLGIGLSMISKQFPESKNALGLIPEIGIQTQLFPQLTMAVLLRNPIPIEIQKGTRFQSDYRLGLCYQPSKGLQLYFGGQKSGTLDPDAHLGVEYQIVKRLQIRFGAKTSGSFSFGTGILFRKNLIFDLLADIHMRLGPRLGIGLNWLF